MDELADYIEVHRGQRSHYDPNLLIAEFDRWKVQEMLMTPEKVAWLWEEMHKYRSLFSTLTENDLRNFTAIMALPDTLWTEAIDEDENIIGILYVTDLARTIDCEVHIMFFDRKPAEKVHLCKQALAWVFERYPLRRMTATIPSIYYRTIKLAKNIGFKEEGRKRESQLLGNKWVDEVILGILRHEVL